MLIKVLRMMFEAWLKINKQIGKGTGREKRREKTCAPVVLAFQYLQVRDRVPGCKGLARDPGFPDQFKPFSLLSRANNKN